MKTTAVNESTFTQEVLQSDLPVLVDLWAPWCGPCQQIAPALEEIATEHEGRFKIAKVNVDENAELTNRFQVRSIPALLFFKDGQLRDRLIGSVPKKMILSRLEALADSAETAAESELVA